MTGDEALSSAEPSGEDVPLAGAPAGSERCEGLSQGSRGPCSRFRPERPTCRGRGTCVCGANGRTGCCLWRFDR